MRQCSDNYGRRKPFFNTIFTIPASCSCAQVSHEYPMTFDRRHLASSLHIYILRSNKVLGWSPFQDICSVSNTSHERVPIWNALRQAVFSSAVDHLIISARLFSRHTLSLASQMVVWMLGEVSLDLHFQVERKFGDMYLNSIIYITFYHYIDISDTIVLLCIAEST